MHLAIAEHDQGGILVIQADPVLGPAAAPELAGPAGIGDELIELGQMRIIHLVGFDIRRDQASQIDAVADVVAPVHAGHAAGPAETIEPEHHVKVFVSWIDPCDGGTVPAVPARRHPLGQDLGESDPAGLQDGTGRIQGAGGHRCGKAGINHAALRSLDVDRPVHPLVVGNIRGGHRGQEGHVDAGGGIGQGGVDEAGNLIVGTGKIHEGLIPLDGDADLDADRVIAESVRIEEALPLVHPVIEPGDLQAHAPLGVLVDLFDPPPGILHPVLLQELEDAPLRHPTGGHLGLYVHPQGIGHAGVDADHVQHIHDRLLLPVDPQRRDADAFVKQFGGPGGVGTRFHSPHISVMSPIDGHELQLPVVEDGLHDGHIGKMGAAEIGIVEHEDIPRVDILSEFPADRLDRLHDRGRVGGNPVDLRHDAVVPIADGAGKIVHLRKDRRDRGVDHGDAHLLVYRQQAVVDHRQGDGITRAFELLLSIGMNAHSCTSITIFP